MTNTAKEVKHILTNDIAIQSCLARELVNVRGLAKYIISKYNLNASVDSVISAVRRFDAHCEFYSHHNRIKDLFDGSSIRTTTNLSAIDIIGKSDIKKCLNQFNSLVDIDKGDTLRLVKGNSHMRVIVDEHNISKLKDAFVLYDKIDIINNLVELSIISKSAENLNQTRGGMARISNEMAMQNVNIVEMIFNADTISIYVDKKDYVTANNILVSLSETKN